MFKLMQIAFRNIFRNKRRTIITEISIIIGIIVIIFVGGLLKDMEVSWRDDLIYSELGHFQIIAKGLKEDENIKFSIGDTRRILSRLEKYENIKGITERISVKGLISTGENSVMFVGNGIFPEKTLKVLPKIKDKLKEGEFIRPDEYDGAVIGQGLAKKLKVTVGDIVMLVMNDKYGSLNAIDIRVVGILEISDEFADDHLVLFHINNARELVSYDNYEASKILLTIDHTKDTLKFKKVLESELSEGDQVEVFSWHSLSGEFNAVVALWSAVNIILTAILLVLALISIMNTILMSVFERMREMGTIMAIGSSPLQIISIYIFESIFIGLFGIMFGVFIGISINFVVSWLGGLPLPPPPGETKGIYLLPHILPMRIMLISGLVLITSILGSLYPARYASKQRPAEVLRTV